MYLAILRSSVLSTVMVSNNWGICFYISNPGAFFMNNAIFVSASVVLCLATFRSTFALSY